MTEVLNSGGLGEVALERVQIEGWWKFEEGAGNEVRDASGNGHTLRAHGEPSWTDAGDIRAVVLDAKNQWLGTSRPVLRTDKSYSVAAWVRLDQDKMTPDLRLSSEDEVGASKGQMFCVGNRALEETQPALTAVSQDTPTHSPFYLGVRAFKEIQPDGTTKSVLRWNFTISPVDGTQTGKLEWRHARSTAPIDASMLGQWTFLVGVCDTSRRTTHLYLPGTRDQRTDHAPDEWKYWRGEGGGLQVGRAHWLGREVDQWPGAIREVRAFSGVLTMEDAVRLYSATRPKT